MMGSEHRNRHDTTMKKLAEALGLPPGTRIATIDELAGQEKRVVVRCPCCGRGITGDEIERRKEATTNPIHKQRL